jgi:hypothetical protein
MKLTYRVNLTAVVALFACSVFPVTAESEQRQQNQNLVVSPKRCVALRQGQICYQEVAFRWQQLQVGNYCLVELPTQEILKCWQQVRSGEFDLDFQYNQSTRFALRVQGQEQNLSVVPITVSWVFKSSKRPKSSWKLF